MFESERDLACFDDRWTETMQVYVVEGSGIVVLGPGPAAMTLTPEAAEHSAHEILRAVNQIRGCR